MTDGITRRDRHVANWARSLKAQGVQFTSEDLQKIIAEDLRLVDRARAEGKLGNRKGPTKKKKGLRQGVARPDQHAEAIAAKQGQEFFARSIPTLETAPRVEKLTGVDAERDFAMQARVRLLSRRGPGRIHANQTIEQGPWEYPAFANQIAMATLAYSAGLGGYRDLKPADRLRRYRRAIEDICNRSDAVVGFGWWVKR
jgi:hypothetical protein